MLLAIVRDITERKRAQEELQRREAHQALVLGSLPMAFYTAQPFGDYGGTWVSEQIDQIAGFTAEEFIEDTHLWASRLHPEDSERVLDAFERLPDIGTLETEYRWQTADGEYVWLLDRAVLARDEDGEPREIVGTWLDVTDRKRADEALRESEQRYRTLAENSPSGIFISSAERFIYVNQRLSQISGFSRDELLNMPEPVKTLFAPEEWEKLLGYAARRLRGDAAPSSYRARGIRKDGQETWLDLAIATVDLSGVRVLQGSVEDVTDRKQAEEEREHLLNQIQEQAHQLQQIVDTVPEGVILLDGKARVVLANPVGKEHLAILADTLVGGTLTRLGSQPLETLMTAPPQGLWHDIAAKGRYFQIIAQPIETGPVLGGWVLVIRDVTQQIEIERRVQQQERLAAVGQLAAGIAHDFNNIMAVITLYANMSLRMPELPPKLYKRLETIDEQARRASDLIQQIMDFSRRAVLERGPMDLLAFAKEQTRLLQRTLPESIMVRLEYGQDEYTIRADPTRIQQVIMNLATNARDAMPEGGQLRITLDLMRLEQGETGPVPEMNPGTWVCLTMADSGAGIPEDVLPHIFDPFFTTKEPGKGTGLGLAQVYGIVKQHEGHIDVHTIKGEGATFIVYLPALAVERAESSRDESTDLPKGDGQIILVVEDDATMREAVASSLESLGYRVLKTANGKEALGALEQQASQVALVLSDMVMPKMGGRVLFRELSRLYPDIKIVLMSGHPMEETVLEELRAEGLPGWLPKPPDLADLAKVIAEALAEDI